MTRLTLSTTRCRSRCSPIACLAPSTTTTWCLPTSPIPTVPSTCTLRSVWMTKTIWSSITENACTTTTTQLKTPTLSHAAHWTPCMCCPGPTKPLVWVATSCASRSKDSSKTTSSTETWFAIWSVMTYVPKRIRTGCWSSTGSCTTAAKWLTSRRSTTRSRLRWPNTRPRDTLSKMCLGPRQSSAQTHGSSRMSCIQMRDSWWSTTAPKDAWARPWFTWLPKTNPCHSRPRKRPRRQVHRDQPSRCRPSKASN